MITVWLSYRAVISRARGEKRKMAIQITLNRLMQRYVSPALVQASIVDQSGHVLTDYTLCS